MIEYPNWFKNTEPNFAWALNGLKNKKINCLQIGAYTGDASIWMYKNLILHPQSILVDVDTWNGSSQDVQDTLELDDKLEWSDVESAYDIKTKDARDDNKIIKYKGSSDDFFSFNNMMYDFIYIDGDHTAKQTEIDANNSWKFLNPGGIMAFDDYEWDRDPNIKKRPKLGIDRFLKKHTDEFLLIIKNYQLWIIKK